MADTDHLTAKQELALHIAAILDGTTFAEQRRRGITAHADRLLEDPVLKSIVMAALRFRAREGRNLRVVDGSGG